MSDVQTSATQGEPVGIVISRGSRAEPAPRFSAYMWCDVPEPTVEPATRRAA